MTQRRYVLTPTGAGVLSLFVPGLIIAGVSGQRLFGVISTGAGLLLAVNAILARRQMGDLTITAVGPTTVTAGDPFDISLTLDSGRPLECAVNVDHAERAWVPVVGPAQGEVVLRVEERGVLDRLQVRLQTSAPFGLTACIRTIEVGLGAPISVAPRPLPASIPDSLMGRHRLDAYGGDEPVGLRPYVVGDTQRDVHWPAVARTGFLVVRDRRMHQSGVDIDVVIDTSLFGADVDVEILLGRARSGLEKVMAAGYQVRLVTTEAGDPSRIVTAPLAGRDDLAARLARVVADPTASVPKIGGVTDCLVATPKGLVWHSPS
ncbi:MAG: DUF58 domain-containing protein [Actinomycetia bacterium]|nr:DUF58 domain-containing protein [Actinomycetes bacterium]